MSPRALEMVVDSFLVQELEKSDSVKSIVTLETHEKRVLLEPVV